MSLLFAPFLRTFFRFLFFLIAIATQIACTRPHPMSPQDSFREVDAPAIKDDRNYADLELALARNIAALRSLPENKLMHFGPASVPYGEYVMALRRLRETILTSKSSEEIDRYIDSHFKFFEFYGGNKWGEVLATGYFEPVLQGSRFPNQKHSYPLYKKPPTLLTINPAQFSSALEKAPSLKGRIHGSNIIPFYTREEIDGKNVLKDKGLELVWVDPIDAFFLHIQGSGTVELPGNKRMHLVYADKNGRRYEPIGKFLKKVLAGRMISMQSITQHLRTLSPAERDALLYKNPSYVFFKRSKNRSITSMGVPATGGRTIAVDRRFAPKGALAFLRYQRPIFKNTKATISSNPDSYITTSRFVLDQDSGGAITGTDHIDLFCGSGQSAQQEAGVMQDKAYLLYLVPR